MEELLFNPLSNSHTSYGDDADFQAAMPVYFSQLAEAWITAVNIDKTGTSGSYTYTRQSGKCGQTAQYCLGADGYNITVCLHCWIMGLRMGN